MGKGHIVYKLGNRGLLKWVPDKLYLRMLYKNVTGQTLHLKDPKTFNEKLQWLKLYDRNPLYTIMVDKSLSKEFAAKTIGDEYIIPTLGVWERFEEIDFSTLPNQFVLKCTHDSGGLVICRNKETFDFKSAEEKICKSLSRNYFWGGREWPYKNVRPRIIAEKYMEDESGYELKDYKIFNFQGKAKIIQVDYDRFVEHKRNLYTLDWNLIEGRLIYPAVKEHPIKKPDALEKMLCLAEKLSENHPFLRTDFYSINEKVYFGELTFFPESGFGKFIPEKLDEELGEWIELSGGGVRNIL